MLSLPNAKQLEDGDLDSDEFLKRLTKAFIDESHWNETVDGRQYGARNREPQQSERN
jgi:hypothetical protein